ncbi:hypothetical protein ACFWYW_47125 [Nonomuraea sp. NPDC059023]|uniref:hypothetical protein n=1 Tax=unclassified Nonomuraea TaxID=2593643 RepID=UPI003697B12F
MNTGAALLVIAVNVVLIAAIAVACDARRHAAALRRENRRLAARLATFTRVLEPLPAMLRGEPGAEIPAEQLAVLALLVEQEGPEGDRLAMLEVAFHQSPGYDRGQSN